MRRFLLAAAAAALLAVVPAAAQCPVLDVKTSVRKTVNGGRHAQLTVRVTDRGLAVTDGGLMLMLPSGMTYSAVKVSPKLSPAPVFQQDPQNSQQVAWTGINMPVKKTRTFRIKLAVDQCAGDTLVPGRHNKTAKATSLYSSDIMIGTFTGPINDMECMVGKTVTTNVRRPKTATNCAPPIPDVLCAIPSGSSGNLNFFGCQTAIGSGVLGAYQIYGQPLDIDATILTLQACLDFCAPVAGTVAVDFQGGEFPFCGCFGTAEFPSNLLLSFNSDRRVYTVGPRDASIPTVECN